MKLNEINFDDNHEMYIKPESLNTEVCLIISDGLAASNEKLTVDYCNKIVNFVNDFPHWYNEVCDIIIKRAKNVYKVNIQNQDLQLMNIFVLFEQNENELFGLEFRVDFDIEHGCGLKIKGKKDNYEIIEIGTGDIAFC